MYKWKKTLSFLMAVALLASSAPVAAALNTDSILTPSIQASAASRTSVDFDTGLEYVKHSGPDSGYAEIVGYSSEDTENGGELVIPEKLGGLDVTQIAKDAFTGEDSATLTKITLPETIEYIGANAFAGCTNVTEGYIPSKFIGICAACKEIEVSENVKQLVVFEVQDAHTTKVSTTDGLASLYTEYKLDGTSLAERALAVPQVVAKADVDGLTAQNFKNFVKKYSAIEKVTIKNKTCQISDGLIPENAEKSTKISGYLGSTAQTYAKGVGKTIGNGLFIPLDGAASDEEILNASNVYLAYADVDGKKKFKLTATADTGNYDVFEVGLLVDRNNFVTPETAETLLTLDSNIDLLNPSKANAKTTSGNIAENGYGLWVRPYALIDNGSGEEDQAVLKYGEPEFIYLESHIKSKITTDFTSSALADPNKVHLETNSSVKIYTLSETGLIIDKDGVITDVTSAKEKLVLDGGFTEKGKAKETVSANVTDIGHGVWAVGYTTVTFNYGGQNVEVTNYSDPIYWEPTAALDSVSVEASATAINDVKFKLAVNADGGGYEVVKTGVIYDKSGTVSNVVVDDKSNAEEVIKQNVANSLKIDSTYYNAKYSADGTDYSLNVSDGGNGIWYVGYAVVKVDGKEEVKYTEPQYAYSELQTEGVAIHMSVTERGKNTAGYDSYRFAAVSRANEGTPVESGIIYNRSDADDPALTKANAEQLMVLTATGLDKGEGKDGTSSGGKVRSKTTGTITSTIVDIGDTGKGIWLRSYIITEDAQGNRTITYSDPHFVHGHEDAVRANLSVKVSHNLVGTNKYWVDATAVTGEYNVGEVGVIVSKNGEVNAENAASMLTLGTGGASDKSIGKKAGVNSTGGNVTDTGNGIWVVGYVTVNVSDTETVTQYSEPVYIH